MLCSLGDRRGNGTDTGDEVNEWHRCDNIKNPWEEEQFKYLSRYSKKKNSLDTLRAIDHQSKQAKEISSDEDFDNFLADE